MNHPSKFARLLPGARSERPNGGTPSLSRSAATFDDQKTTHRGHGACHFRVMGLTRRDASFPAHRLGRVHMVAADSARAIVPSFCPFWTVPPLNLAGAFNSSGPFPNLSTQPRRQAVRYVLPSHLKASMRYGYQRSAEPFADEQNPCVAGAKYD